MPVSTHEPDSSRARLPVAAGDPDTRRPGAARATMGRLAATLTVVGGLAAGSLLLWFCGDGGAAATGPPGAGDAAVTSVRAARAEGTDLSVFAEYPGELVGEAADLAPRVGGRIEAVRVRVGDPVAAGQEVAVIDATDLRRELEQARARVAVAEANRDRAAARLREEAAALERARSLAADALISAQEFERIQAAASTATADVAAAAAAVQEATARVGVLEQQVAETRVAAPFAGSIAARYLDPGAVVQPSTPIVRLVQADPLRVQFRVPERDVGRLAVGSPISLTTQATGARLLAGHVQRISGEVSRQDRTVLVEGIVDEHTEVVRPGMYASVRARLERIEAAVVVPGLAVSRRVTPVGREEVGVFVVVDDGRTARWRPVTIRGTEGSRVAVDGDVRPGDTVLTLGYEELRDGSAVEIVADTGSTP